MAMEPLDWVCMNHLLLLLEHGNRCMVVVKKKKNSNGAGSAIRQKFTIQKHTSVKPHAVKPKFQKNIPTSNHDLTKWCKYLNIPIKDVLSRDHDICNDMGKNKGDCDRAMVK